jgi:MscS family membrane protein
VAVLNELGFQVASLLAGLGIGGIALALAAQKTVENLFGSVAIGVDQPFRVGDVVRIEDVTGTVEAIGMRSTRIRTLDRTVVSYPNGKLADMRAETLASRDRIRLVANLGLAYGTTAEQMRAVLAGVEAALRRQPKLWTESLSVRFTEFRDSTLNVEVIAWFTTSDWSEFTAIRQEVLLELMAVVERAGTTFAYPTRTVHVVQDRPGG